MAEKSRVRENERRNRMRRIKKLFAGVVLFMLAMAFSVTASAASYPDAPYMKDNYVFSDSGYVRFEWTKISKANGYRLKFLDYSKQKVTTKNLPGNGNTYYSGYLNPNAVYRVSVCAYKVKNGKKYYGNERGGWIAAKRVNKTAASGRNWITFKWNRLYGANGYYVYRSYSQNSAGRVWKRLSGTATSVRITGVTKKEYVRIVPYKTVNGKNYGLPYYTHMIY